MRYLITALAITLAACQPADIDPSLERVVAVPSPEPAVEVEQPLRTYCLPNGEINEPGFFYDSNYNYTYSWIVVQDSLTEQGLVNNIDYTKTYQDGGVLIESETYQYGGVCHGS